MSISGDGGRDGVPLEFLLPFIPTEDERPWKKRGKGLVALLEGLASDRLPRVVESARRLQAEGWRLRLAILGVACVPPPKVCRRIGDHLVGEPCPWVEYFRGLGLPLIPEETFGSPRSLPEVEDALLEAWDRTWYERSVRHMITVSGDPDNPHAKVPPPDIVSGILTSQMEVEKKYGAESLEHASECPFEAGTIVGKLSALRWLTGEPWDSLDT